MRQLVQQIPEVDALLALEPEELGSKLLFLLRTDVSQHQNGMFYPTSKINELWNDRHDQSPTYSRTRINEINLALTEAYAWLEAQGLIVPAPDSNGQNGWRVLSRRALKFTDEAEFANYAIARHLSRETLHPRIANKVWLAFMRGEFDVAVFQATKAIEVHVREKTGLEELGVKLMRKAFHPQNGPLTDMSAEDGEREAMASLFAGTIGVFKNPHSHREVNLEDPIEAMEIIMLANRLLKIVDTRPIPSA